RHTRSKRDWSSDVCSSDLAQQGGHLLQDRTRACPVTILEKVTALLGEGAVLEPSTDRVPRIAPGSPDAVALLLGTAHQEGWRVRSEERRVGKEVRSGRWEE